jgi:hypothetical protein
MGYGPYPAAPYGPTVVQTGPPPKAPAGMYVAIIGAIIAIVGTCLPWFSFFGMVMIGLASGGVMAWIPFIFSIVILVLEGFAKYNRMAVGIAMGLSIGVLVCPLIMIALIASVWSMMGSMGMAGFMGVGPFVTMIGGIMALIGAASHFSKLPPTMPVLMPYYGPPVMGPPPPGYYPPPQQPPYGGRPGPPYY